jgi:hypothetical protein
MGVRRRHAGMAPPRVADLKRWRINTLVNWNGMWIAGDFSSGRLYGLDWFTQTEDGTPMERRRITGVLSDQGNGIIVNAMKIGIDTGNPQDPPVSDHGIDPVTTAVKYLVVPTTNTTDYSGVSFDDSSWSMALAPFGNAPNADAATHGFPADPVTNWPLSTNLWYRYTLLLNPSTDMLAKIYVDDGVQFFVNGVMVYEYIPPEGSMTFYHEVTIPGGYFVNGDNVLAMKSLELYGALSYFAFTLEQAP